MIHSFLLIGQSNMAGRGVIGSVPNIENDRIFVLRNARWQPMFFPVNPDRPFSGLNLAESFADAYTRDHADAEVGLIPCADGGTALSQWMPGELLYDHAVAIARLAMRTSVLRGILWHQGETDCAPGLSATYAPRLREMLRTLRRVLGAAHTPILLGALGDYLAEYDAGTRTYYPVVNQALEAVAETEQPAAFVPAHGLGSKPDHLHFDASALREFGLRYYAAYRKIEPEIDEPSAVEDGKTHSAMEAL